MKGLLRLLGLLPLRVQYVLGDGLAFLAEKVLRYRRDVVSANLERCFPALSEQERRRISRDFYRHLGEIVAETVWFGSCPGGKRLRRRRLVELENPEVADRLFQGAPSLVLLTSHAGNWELSGGILTYNYTDRPDPFTEQNYCVVYLRQSSEMWNDILRDNRTAPLADPAHFPGYLESREVVRYAFSHRDEKKVYNFITDQHPYFSSVGTFDVDFFGQKVQTMAGGASLAHKLGLAVAYASMQRTARGRYVTRYTAICEDASTMEPQQIMQRYYNLLEQDIRENPSNYLWTHRRFKRIT